MGGFDEVVQQLAEQPGENHVYDGDQEECEEAFAGVVADGLGDLREVEDGDVADDGSAFHQGDGLEFVGWQGVDEGLRGDDIAENLVAAESEGDTGVDLALAHGVERRLYDGAGEIGEVEREGQHGGGDAPAALQHNVVEEQEEDHDRCAAHDKTVALGRFAHP